MALYVSGQMSHGGAVPGEQAGQGLPAHQPHRVELAAVHGQRGNGLQAVAGLRRPARLLRRLRPRRPVLRHRLEHGRLPSDPVPAHGRPAQGRRQADRRRPAPHRHRRQGRPVPADQAGHRPGPAQRTAAPAGRERRHRRGVHRRAHRGLGGDAGVPGRLPAATGSPRSPGWPRPTSAPPRR